MKGPPTHRLKRRIRDAGTGALAAALLAGPAGAPNFQSVGFPTGPATVADPRPADEIAALLSGADLDCRRTGERVRFRFAPRSVTIDWPATRVLGMWEASDGAVTIWITTPGATTWSGGDRSRRFTVEPDGGTIRLGGVACALR